MCLGLGFCGLPVWAPQLLAAVLQNMGHTPCPSLDQDPLPHHYTQYSGSSVGSRCWGRSMDSSLNHHALLCVPRQHMSLGKPQDSELVGEAISKAMSDLPIWGSGWALAYSLHNVLSSPRVMVLCIQ